MLMLPAMNAHHAVVWLDHIEAKVFKFTGDAVGEIDVHAKPHAFLHNRNAVSGRREENAPYYASVIEALSDVAEFLVLGPSTAKLEFVKHVHRTHPEMEPRLIGLETVDHPTDGQIVAYAKKYFVKADRMR